MPERELILATPGCANDLVMARYLADRLTATYPGWLWGVNVDGATGMCDIKNFNLSGNWGYRLKLKEVYSSSSLEADVVRAGGEILERYRQRRGKFNGATYEDLRVNAAGIPIGDKTAAPNSLRLVWSR